MLTNLLARRRRTRDPRLGASIRVSGRRRTLRVPGFTYGLLGRALVDLTEVTLTAPSASGRTRIAFASDLHAGSPGWRHTLRSLIHVLRRVEPDHLILGGDLVDADLTFLPDILGPLSQAAGAFEIHAVRGNHDTRKGSHVEWRAHLDRFGVRDLTNQSAELAPGIQIGGLDDGLRGRPDPEGLGREMDPDSLRIGVVHNPEEVAGLPEGLFDMILSGHTHGGQVCLPLFGALRGPSAYTLNHFEGWARIGSHDALVSRGIGTVHIPVRLFCRAEAVVLDVRSESEEA